MFKQDSQSIQQLLVAEKNSEDRINQSRKRKNLRLKQAKEEAQAEIEIFRAEREKEFKEFESKFLGTKEIHANKLEKETEKLLMEMQKYVKLNKATIVEFLLEQILAIDCHVHENFRPEAH